MRKIASFLGVMLIILLAACTGKSTPETPEPSNTPEPTATPEPTDTPEPTATPEPTDTPEPALAPGYEEASAFGGSWEGEWQNLTFGSSGSAEALVTIREDGSLSVTVDLGGSVFGMGDPPPLTFEGTYDGEVSRIRVEGHQLFGNFEVKVEDENLSVQADDIPVERISSMEVTGTITPETLDAEYVIYFPDETTAKGTLKMTHSE